MQQQLHKYGLAFHIDAVLKGEQKRHVIKSALMSDSAIQSQKSQRTVWTSFFSYQLPELVGDKTRTVGAEETLGIYGGISDESQRYISEIVERNIGDVLISVFTKFLLEVGEKHISNGQHLLIIMGYPLPKVIGRFASLRLPRDFKIVWLYSYPPPAWLEIFPGWHAITGYRLSENKIWAEDQLIIQEQKIIGEREYWVSWLNQYISYDSVHRNPVLNYTLDTLTAAPWIDDRSQLPLVLSLACLMAVGVRMEVFKDKDKSALNLMAYASLAELDTKDLKEKLEEKRKNIRAHTESKPFDYPLFTPKREATSISTEDFEQIQNVWNNILS